MKKAFVIIALLAVAACNTIDGMGEDTSAAGRAVSNAAENTQQNM